MKTSYGSLQPLLRPSTLRAELARRRLLDFALYTMPQYRAGRVHAFMAGELERVERGEVQRLMLFLPPRTGKTELLIRFLAWCLGRNPDWPMLYTSYGADLAWEKSGEARAVVASEEFGEVFGGLRYGVKNPHPGPSPSGAQAIPAGEGSGRTEVVELDPTSRAVQRWKIKGRRGGLQAQGVGGPITGKGGRLIVVDDPVKNREEADSATMREKTWRWYTSTLRTRLEPDGAIVVVLTRWHDDDLAGRLLELAKKDRQADQWRVVSLPAIALDAGEDALGRRPGEALDPARFDEAALLATRASIGSRDWSALYQQDPQPDGGSVFQLGWFAREDGPARSGCSQVVQAWDTAYKTGQENDISACVTIGMAGNRLHVLDAWKGRLEFPELVTRVKEKARQWSPNLIVVEDKASGTSALQVLRRETMLPIVAVQPDRDKVGRANLVTPLCEAGRVAVPATWWGDELLDELVRFPAGAHDDLVDALVYALMRLGAGQVQQSALPDLLTGYTGVSVEGGGRPRMVTR